MTSQRTFWHALGPGLLFAGASVGVSHLVQSTRAGAMFGMGLLLFVLIANVIKYPAFSFGPRYAAATGMSLLEGYRRRGKWALALYGLLTVATMWTVQAAVTIVTAGLATRTVLPSSFIGLETSALSVSPEVIVSFALLVISALLLATGGYRLLDRLMKVVVVVLTLSTVTATFMALGTLDSASINPIPPPETMDRATLLFIAGLMGWMPSAIDISVWHSLWTLERGRDSGKPATVAEASLDFNIGYLGTAMLALCFLTMGAGVMHGSGVEFQDSAGAFAGQIIALYTTTLGEWAGPVMGLCAFSVMLSTTITVLDGFSRALATFVDRLQRAEVPGQFEGSRVTYLAALALIGGGSLCILQFYLGGLKSLIDLATTLSFLTSPMLAWLNHKAMWGDEVPLEHRPSERMRMASAICIVLLAVFAIGWLGVKFLT